MNQKLTKAIVLSRINYGEADRIITVLTPDSGKLTLIAKGVRKSTSKLAGGIELFSESEIGYIEGRSGGMGTLTTSRLIKYYDNIVKNLDRTTQGYEYIRLLNKITEDITDAAEYDLLRRVFASLDDFSIALDLVQAWFLAQLLHHNGSQPNLDQTNNGEALSEKSQYKFDIDSMSLFESDTGQLDKNHIKLLRLLFADTTPKQLNSISGLKDILSEVAPLVLAMQRTYLRV